MKRCKENVFMKKFNTLNTQDHCDYISWSSSDNSDNENICLNSVSNICQRKRKRKKKAYINLNSLNVSTIHASNAKNQTNNDRSPVLCSKYSKNVSQSPVIKPRLQNPFKKDANIICSPRLNNKTPANEKRSPIFITNHKSPATSPNVRKKLFKEIDTDVLKHSTSKINAIGDKNLQSTNYDNTCIQDIKLNCKNVFEAETEIVLHESVCSTMETPLKTSNGVIDKRETQLELMKKVQSYFDGHFSSESASQQSISECETVTPQSTQKSCEDFEISNTITQTKCLKVSPEQNCTFVPSKDNCLKKKKKIKYKKDGLAFRLASLLRKQNSNVSLWQHEQFLAKNSNFIIPKCEYTVFRIQKVNFEYNCYLVEGRDLKDDDYLLLINACYVNSTCIIVPEYILKLYQPYNIIDLQNHRKVVVNVCKFESIPMTM